MFINVSLLLICEVESVSIISIITIPTSWLSSRKLGEYPRFGLKILALFTSKKQMLA